MSNSTANESPALPGFDTDMNLESLCAVERTLFANPHNDQAIRWLACYVRQIGERLIAAEKELIALRKWRQSL